MADLTTDTIAPDSLEWALAHLLRFGDSDITTVPFEYAAIRCDWVSFKAHLSAVDIGNHKLSGAVFRLLPKPDGTFRVATRLDPLDCILYTAMVHECCSLIEKGRIPKASKVVFSYRLEVTADGSFFSKETGWTAFQHTCSHLAARYPVVVTADIADFYTQLSLHRIENALENVGVSRKRASNIEEFLSGINASQSRGLPVGPHASIILAEAALSDVDKFLIGKSVRHVRYVDDFRIFCRSAQQARDILHDLSWYLHTSHRLALQSSKTQILASKQFIRKFIDDPQKDESRKKEEKVALILAAIHDAGYSDVEIGEVDQSSLAAETLKDLFTDCVSASHLPLGMARHVLRRAAALRTNMVLSQVLSHLTHLVPAMRDVAVYLMKAGQGKHKKQVIKVLVSYLRRGEWCRLPLVREWILEVLCAKYRGGVTKPLAKLVEKWSDIGVRSRAMVARVRGDIDWVRQHKEAWRPHGSWDRRAVIASATVLAGDEKEKWLGTVRDTDDVVDRAVAKWVLSGCPPPVA